MAGGDKPEGRPAAWEGERLVAVPAVEVEWMDIGFPLDKRLVLWRGVGKACCTVGLLKALRVLGIGA